MGKLNFAAYKSERAVELSNLAKILKKTRVVQDTKPVEDAATECLKGKPNGKDDTWGYKIKDLLFQGVEDVRKIRPKSLAQSAINLALDVELSAYCVNHDNNEIDFISNLSVNLILSDQSKKYRQSWHFDRHIQSPGDSNPDAAHPIYHFQSGGRHIQDFSDEFFGNILFVEGPRIAHPPMDGILAIDFVLSNYFGKIWKGLFRDHDYQKLVGAMQRKIWKPYANSFHSTWAPPTGVYHWDPIEILPQIIRETKKATAVLQVSKKKK